MLLFCMLQLNKSTFKDTEGVPAMAQQIKKFPYAIGKEKKKVGNSKIIWRMFGNLKFAMNTYFLFLKYYHKFTRWEALT